MQFEEGRQDLFRLGWSRYQIWLLKNVLCRNWNPTGETALFCQSARFLQEQVRSYPKTLPSVPQKGTACQRKPFPGLRGEGTSQGVLPSLCALPKHRLPAVVLPTGEPEGTVTAIAVCRQVVRKPSRHLGERKDTFIKERTIH